MTIDLINGMFEFIGSGFIWYNVYTLYKDQEIKGVDWPAIIFFILWSIWNLIYYPNLEQYWSFIGSISLIIGDIAWLILAIKYSRSKKDV